MGWAVIRELKLAGCHKANTHKANLNPGLSSPARGASVQLEMKAGKGEEDRRLKMGQIIPFHSIATVVIFCFS